jgi:hypothetical protein
MESVEKHLASQPIFFALLCAFTLATVVMVGFLENPWI